MATTTTLSETDVEQERIEWGKDLARTLFAGFQWTDTPEQKQKTGKTYLFWATILGVLEAPHEVTLLSHHERTLIERAINYRKEHPCG